MVFGCILGPSCNINMYIYIIYIYIYIHINQYSVSDLVRLFERFKAPMKDFMFW